jgi:hypothetical protein
MKEIPGYGVEGKKTDAVWASYASDNHATALPTIKSQHGLMWLKGWYITP